MEAKKVKAPVKAVYDEFMELLKAPKEKRLKAIGGIKAKLHKFLESKDILEYTYVVEHHMIGSNKRKPAHLVSLEIHQKDYETGKIKKRRRENIQAITNVYVVTLDDTPVMGAYSYCAAHDEFDPVNGELVAMRKLHKRMLGK